MQYAIIDENNIVTRILETDESFSSFMPKSAIVIDNVSPKPEPGWAWNGVDGFIPGEYAFDETPNLHLSSDKYCIKADGADTATITAELKDIEGNILNVTTTDFAVIPGYGALKIEFENGKSSIPFSVNPEKSGKIVFTNKDSTKYYVVEPLTIFAFLEC